MSKEPTNHLVIMKECLKLNTMLTYRGFENYGTQTPLGVTTDLDVRILTYSKGDV
jgi:hypothetical protein